VVSFVPDKAARQDACPGQSNTAGQDGPPLVGRVRQEDPSQQNQPKRHGQVGVVGYRAKGYLHEAEVMHKDFIALVPPVAPGNVAADLSPAQPPAESSCDPAKTEGRAMLPEAGTHEHEREQAQGSHPHDLA